MEVYIVTQKPVEKNIILDMGTTKSVQDNNLYLTLTQQKKTDQEKTETEKMEYIITLEPLNDALNQIWKIYSTTNNAVCISATTENLVLDVVGGIYPSPSSSEDFAELTVWPPNSAPNQRFYLFPDGTIRPENTDFCITPKPDTKDIKSQVGLKRINTTTGILENQKFHLSTPLLNK